MLPRRHIRVKVFQSLYTYSQQNNYNNFNIEREFQNNLNAYKNLYYLLVDLLSLIYQVAQKELDLKQKESNRKKENLKPNKKFINNIIFKKIKTRKTKNIDFYQLESLAKTIFKNIQTTKIYLSYMNSQQSNYELDKKITLHILKEHIVSNQKIHDFIEERSIYWNDDLLIVYNMFLEKLNNNVTLNSIKLFRHEEDEVFANNLLMKTIYEEEKISQTIYNLAQNWDEERIALADLIIMKMAIIEIQYIKNIPHKVTLDQYIELAKEYSTPKSKDFINGILDRFIKDIFKKNDL